MTVAVPITLLTATATYFGSFAVDFPINSCDVDFVSGGDNGAGSCGGAGNGGDGNTHSPVAGPPFGSGGQCAGGRPSRDRVGYHHDVAAAALGPMVIVVQSPGHPGLGWWWRRVRQ